MKKKKKKKKKKSFNCSIGILQLKIILLCNLPNCLEGLCANYSCLYQVLLVVLYNIDIEVVSAFLMEYTNEAYDDERERLLACVESVDHCYRLIFCKRKCHIYSQSPLTEIHIQARRPADWVQLPIIKINYFR